MSDDLTEVARMVMLANSTPERDLAQVQAVKGQRWDTAQLQQDFVVHGFLAPFVVVTRKSDNAKGSMEFTHNPRWYFNFVPDNES